LRPHSPVNKQGYVITALLLSLCCFTLALLPHRDAALGWLAKPDLPTLIDPSRPLAYWQIRANRGARVTHAKQSNTPSLVVHLVSGSWPGARLFDPLPDWSGCETLVLDASSADDAPLHAMVRIHDNKYDRTIGAEDRFRTELILTPMRQQHRIYSADIQNMGHINPARQLDTAAITDVLLFARESDIGRAIHVYSMSLEDCLPE